MGGNALVHVLECVWHSHGTTKSNFSRAFADEIAEAACRGLITTRASFASVEYGRTWRITGRGIKFLKRARKDAQAHSDN